jgi:hypothetical protein
VCPWFSMRVARSGRAPGCKQANNFVGCLDLLWGWARWDFLF